nr:immunoglobulin heavy chain junction region [Macaca mulatta]MOV51312.1 immunoglobulin heavy chain junction region [Macaca mulatta]
CARVGCSGFYCDTPVHAFDFW